MINRPFAVYDSNINLYVEYLAENTIFYTTDALEAYRFSSMDTVNFFIDALKKNGSKFLDEREDDLVNNQPAFCAVRLLVEHVRVNENS